MLVSCAIAYRLASTRQPPATFTETPVTIVVDTQKVSRTQFPVQLKTRGQVMARTQSSVVPEVSGSIREVGENFREGGFFEQGEVLLSLDDRDYRAALATARSSLATAQTVIAEETARSQQATEDWKRLGRTEPPPPLVARLPQLAEAKAKGAAMEAQVEKASRDLERTVLRAAYKGRVLEKMVDVGQYVAAGREIGKIFAVDYAEIRLPIADEQLAFLKLPESFRDDTGKVSLRADGPKVSIQAKIAGELCQWEGTIVRSSATVDSQTLQSYVTAQVEDPYARRPGNASPLKVGQWVEAVLPGKILENVIKLPRSAVRDGNEVLLVTPENKLRRRAFTRAWADPDFVLAADGLADGEVICTTPLSFAVEGAVVSPVGTAKTPPEPGSPTTRPKS
jgi:membrane fusion protein, multidrug efflux system